jgi:hypothetical protein
MYKLIEWSPNLDLTEFYAEASKRGFENNSSQKVMVDCFNNEKEKQVWIMYQDQRPVGSVAAHSFDDVMGSGSYRILTRVCSFAEARKDSKLLTFKKLMEHQTLNDQFFFPKCIEWAGRKNLYATSNDSKMGSQRLVHNYYFPGLAEKGIAERVTNVFYRGLEQTVWKLDADAFEESLKRYPRWT